METISFDEAPAERPKKKSPLHRWIMLFCGAFMFASGLAAAYLAFSAEGGLTGAFLAAHSLDGLRNSLVHLPSRPTPPTDPMPWREWGPEAFADAAAQNRLVLLDFTAPWCHECHLMDELTYSHPNVRRWIETHVIPVRVDSDDRPYLLRYLASGWPTTALLLPTGEILSSGAFMPAGGFLDWARRTEGVFRNRPDDVAAARESVREAARQRREKLFARRDEPWTEESAHRAAAAALSRLEQEFDVQNGGFGRARKFPSPQVNRFLAEQKSFSMLDKTLEGELRLMDPVWGGLYRYSETPDWRTPRYEKLLLVQAGAFGDFVAAYSRTKDERWLRAAGRVEDYVETFLRRPDGFFAAAQDSDLKRTDGSWLEGDRFYGLVERGRQNEGVPAQVSGELLEPNADWASALLRAGAELDRPAWKQAGLELAEQVWTRGVDRSGAARRRLDGAGPVGLLADELAAARMELAAAKATGDSRHARRFLTVFQFIRHDLADAESGAEAYAPAAARTGIEAAWPAVDADETAAAALLFLDAAALGDASVNAEAQRLLGWAAAHAELIEPSLLGRLAAKAAGS